jgi:putative transposase
MPWNTQNEMTERTKMIVEHEEGGYSIAALARRHGVSRKTAMKWIARFEQEQWSGLQERSRARHTQAHAFSHEVEQQVLMLKQQWPLWGAPKLRHKLLGLRDAQDCPGESTVGAILRRHGLTKPMKPRRIKAPTSGSDYGNENNQTWCADFKGWWRTGDGRRCDPLTITDASSRYLIRCLGLSGSTATAMVQPIFIAAFREYGLPQALRTDNGPPFASNGLCGLSRLSVWWLKLGIALERIDPGHPEQNGRHERMHRTLKDAMGPPARNLRAQQEAMNQFRRDYNEERPHEALGMAVPASQYEASSRAWSERAPAPPEYPDGWQTRKVRPNSQIKWHGKNITISDALVGEQIGFKPQGDGLWSVYFGSYALGHFDERKKRLQPVRRQRQKPTPPSTVPAEQESF